jgi:hypothetical protein
MWRASKLIYPVVRITNNPATEPGQRVCGDSDGQGGTGAYTGMIERGKDWIAERRRYALIAVV